ncbi:MAG: hypothetical protein ABR969_03555 [Sedimentisphaerales bacterium]|jgi:hypothetical protein
MINVNKKYVKSAALAWVSCFLLFFLIYLILVAPQRTSREQINRQLTEKKQTLDAVLKISQKDVQVQLNEQMGQWRSKLKGFVANHEDMVGLTFDLGQIANEIKVDLFSVKVQDNRDSKEIPGCQYIGANQISIRFKADFNKFAAFLNAVERHRPVIFVDKFTISHDNPDDLTCLVNMDLSVFVKKPQGS